MKDAFIGQVVDAYSLIKSPEIRDFFRTSKKLGIFDQEQVILHSYIPLRQKMAMLKQLSYTGDEGEAALINEMHDFIAGYLEQICNPAVRTVFSLECVDTYLENGNIKTGREYWGVFDTVDEVVMKMEELIEDMEENEISSHGLVSVVQVPRDEKLRQPFEFSIFRINGEWQVKDIFIYDIDRFTAHDSSISENTSFRFSNNAFSHPLPFEHGSRLKFKLPFMEKPFYGVLSSKKDENGNWHHYLYDDNTEEQEGTRSNVIDLSYMEVNQYSGYSSLDWIERA